MFTCWSLIAFLQLVTMRYTKHWWRYNQTAHMILGSISGLFTFAASIIILHAMNWSFSFETLHHKVGIFAIFIAQMLVIGGVVVAYKRRNIQPWTTRTTLIFGLVHKVFGWLMLLFMQLVVGTGIMRYYGFDD
jgi:hypothetical protein